MDKQFDPYLKWLGIAPADQPPNHYRLLGIPELIDDADVIENAADRQMTHVRSFAGGKHAELSQKLLAEISQAKVCLLDPQAKQAYDQKLRAAAAAKAPPPAPTRPVLKTRSTPKAQLREAQPLPPTPATPPLSTNPRTPSNRRKSTTRQAAIAGVLLLVAVGLAFGFYLATSSDPVVAEQENEPNTPEQPPEQPTPPEEDRGPSDLPETETSEKTPSKDPATVGLVVEKPDDPETTETVATGDPQSTRPNDQTIDLLKQIDLKRDVVEGNWKMEGGALIATSDGTNQRVMIPGSVPDEYLLTLELERISGNSGPVVGLIAAKKQVEAYFDFQSAGKYLQTGMYQSHHGQESDVEGPLLKNDSVNEIQFRVTESDIVAHVNNRFVFKQPITSKLGVYGDWATPRKDVLFLGFKDSSFRVRKIELKPLDEPELAATDSPSPQGSTVDLLKHIDLKRDVVEGQWSMDGSTLVMPPATLARLMVPYSVPDEYLLELEVNRTSDNNMLLLGLVVRGKMTHVAIDYSSSGQTHYSTLTPRERFTPKVGALLPAGKPHHIRCQVTTSRVVIWVDDKLVFDQRERLNELDVAEVWKFPRNDVLCLGGHHSGFEVTRFELTPLADIDTFLPTEKKLPLPTGAPLAKAQATLREVFKDDLAAAKTDEERIAVAKSLLKASAESGADPTEVFVMLQAARKLAAKSGGAKTALAAIDSLADQFAIDRLELKAEALTEAAKEIRQQEEQAAMATLAGTVVLEMVEADRFDLAEPLTKVVQTAAIKSRNVVLRKDVAASIKQFKSLHDAYREVEPAFDKLQASPDDPEAHLAVGRYRAVVKHDWPSALEHLIAGSDATLKALATQDLAGADTTDDQVKLGDAWWDAAENEKGETQEALKSRAGYWYRQAITELTGLAKERIDKRLVEILAIDPAQRINPDDWDVRSIISEGTWLPFPPEAFTREFNGGILTVTRKPTPGRPAFLLFKPFVGDRPFVAAMEIRGNFAQLGMQSANAHDSHVAALGPGDDQWHTFTIQRNADRTLRIAMDGKIVEPRIHRTDGKLVGSVTIWLASGQSCDIRRFHVQAAAKR